ncbi:alpha/beta hydrolase [Novosphingobium sp. CCH12-A3]|uniref:alpha/beta hydrolase n=1 Tax=Novosphingobium sp. CCH12-A3 TaxID=1768752 RepID=UPI000A709BB1|nr:alpha/beta hydrolase [Novosphingobium sp. CCH12-A3]
MNDLLQQLIAGMRQGGPDFSGDPLKARADFEDLLASMPVSEDLTFSEIELGGVRTLHSPTSPANKGALLYFHGGAFAAGSARGYRGLAADLGRAAGVQTFSVDYRLAPEEPFPAAVEDATAAYRALLDQGVDHRRIVFGGDSAGGGLAVSALVKLRDDQVPLPAAAVLLSPWVDLACASVTMTSKADADPSLTAAGLQAMARVYLAGTDATHPLASPVHADLSGLPPLMIQVGSAEILLGDAVKLAERAGTAGTSVRLDIWPEMIHVWQAFAFLLDEGRVAIEEAGQFLRRSVKARGK